MKIGLGLVTYNRPDYFQHSIKGITDHLLDRVDHIFVYNDGSTKGKRKYQEIYKSLPQKIVVYNAPANRGVAHAKNWCLQKMMDAGCDYLFISEDDVVVQDRGAVVQYIATAYKMNCHNLAFAHHGTENLRGPIMEYPGVAELYTSLVGAWNLYTRQAIAKVGLMDENFHNAWEHVEHTYRIIKADMAPPFGYYMDVWDSERYIKEIPGSIKKSSIRVDKSWEQDMLKGLYYWRDMDPQFPMDHTIKLLESGKAFDNRD